MSALIYLTVSLTNSCAAINRLSDLNKQFCLWASESHSKCGRSGFCLLCNCWLQTLAKACFRFVHTLRQARPLRLGQKTKSLFFPPRTRVQLSALRNTYSVLAWCVRVAWAWPRRMLRNRSTSVKPVQESFLSWKEKAQLHVTEDGRALDNIKPDSGPDLPPHPQCNRVTTILNRKYQICLMATILHQAASSGSLTITNEKEQTGRQQHPDVACFHGY